MRRWLAVAMVLVAVGGACSLTTSFDGISGTRPADTGTTPTGDTGTPTDTTMTTDAPMTDGTTDGGHAAPPTRPPGDPVPGTGSRTLWLGVKHFHFAHSNDSLKKPGAWEDWGWDIDGLCTGATASDQAGSCIRSPLVTPDQIRDGKNCRDNNFGSQIVPQLNVYNNAFENDTNNGLLAGTPAWVFVLEDLGDGVDDPYVPGKLYLAAQMPDKVRPAWDGTDVRTILPRSVTGGDVTKPIVTFAKGYVRNNVWVSGEPQSFETSLPIGDKGELMPLPIVNGVIAFQLNAGHTSVVDGTGQVAGALAVASVENFLKPFLLTQTTFCPGSSQYNNLMKTISTYGDVVVGAAKLQDPTKSCDGISLGIGINMAPIAAATALGPEQTPSPGACGTPDAGGD
jgi:hypothetical protein